MKRFAFAVLIACGSAPQPAPKTAPPVAPTSVTAPAPPPAPVIGDDVRARDFIDKLAHRDFTDASVAFSDSMHTAMPPDKLELLWTQLQQQLGPFASIDNIEVKLEAGMSLALVTTAFASRRVLIRVVFSSDHHIAGLSILPVPWQPPPYATPDAFEEREVSIGNPALPGTLTLPKGAQHVPAIVLVHGSGPGSRDEVMGSIEVFHDLAWGLASRGIAVLRYDKRSLVHPEGVRTQKDEVDEAAHAAIALLRAQPEVDASRIALLGHSQGGYLAPRIATADPAIKRLVIFAGSAQPLEDSILMQAHYFKTLHPDEPKLDEMIAKADKFKAAIVNPKLKPDDPVENLFGGQAFTGAYFLDVRDYHPERVAAKLKIPILVLQGERDYQVSPTVDFARWKAALDKKKNVTFHTYPGLSHAFNVGEGPPGPADYVKPTHVDKQVIDDLAAWLSAP